MNTAALESTATESPATRMESGWSVGLPQPNCGFSSVQYFASPDGVGGCLVLGKYTISTDEILFRAFWIDGEGGVLAKDLCHGAGFDLVLIRLNGTAAYFLRVATKSGPVRTPDILKLLPTGEAFRQTLNPGEVPLMPSLPSDPNGMFTVTVGDRGEPQQVRRIVD